MFYLTCIVMAMLCVCCISKRVHSRQSNWRHSTSSMALWRTMTSTYGTLYLMTLMALPIERSIVSIHRTHVDCPYHLNSKNAVNMMTLLLLLRLLVAVIPCRRRPCYWMTWQFPSVQKFDFSSGCGQELNCDRTELSLTFKHCSVVGRLSVYIYMTLSLVGVMIDEHLQTLLC